MYYCTPPISIVPLSDTNLSYFYNFDENRPDVCVPEFFSREQWTDEGKFDRNLPDIYAYLLKYSLLVPGTGVRQYGTV